MAREIGWYGWFKNKNGERYEAYWDGSAWTERRPQQVMVSEVAEASGEQDVGDGLSAEVAGTANPAGQAEADKRAGKWLIGEACLLSVVAAIIAMPLILTISSSFRGDSGADAFGAFFALSFLVWFVVSAVAAGLSVRKIVGDRGGYLFLVSVVITGAVYAVVFVGLTVLIFLDN